MAINRGASTNEQLNLVINNGELQALRDNTNRLGFASEENMLRFMLAVLSQSATRSVVITDRSGSKISLNPSDDLLRSTPPPVPTEPSLPL